MGKYTVENLLGSGVLLITPGLFKDDRGYFMESFNARDLNNHLGNIHFVQENESRSAKGVLRGLHFQEAPFEQSKLIRVVEGVIWDVAVDIRPSSATFKHWVSHELSAENHEQLYIPKGFAHGFVALSDYATIIYKTDEFYYPESEAGILAEDEELAIDWPLPQTAWSRSQKDKELPTLSDWLMAKKER